MNEILDALWRHDVVPVVVRDRGEEHDLPAWGLMELQDLETSRRRLAVMRPECWWQLNGCLRDAAAAAHQRYHIEPHVRQFARRSAIAVVAIIFPARCDSRVESGACPWVAELCATLAASAYRMAIASP